MRNFLFGLFAIPTLMFLYVFAVNSASLNNFFAAYKNSDVLSANVALVEISNGGLSGEIVASILKHTFFKTSARIKDPQFVYEDKLMIAHISSLLGGLRYGDTSLISYLGRFGIGLVSPSSSPEEVIRMISSRARSLDPNSQEALLSGLGFNMRQKELLKTGNTEEFFRE